MPHLAQRPEVLDVGAPAPSVCTLVENERRRRESAYEGNAPVNHLYPPDKGWVRLDPASQFDVVSLTDLAVLVNDPSDVATILLRLTDDDGGTAGTGGTALEQKFTDITTLFSSLDPRLARVMFGKLARAVLELDPERRSALLQRTILPGLLDGRADGNVLRDFPDVDLAESLCSAARARNRRAGSADGGVEPPGPSCRAARNRGAAHRREAARQAIGQRARG